MHKNRAVLIIGIIASVLSACAEVESEDLRTSGIYAEMHVTAEDDSAFVQARLRTGRALDADSVLLSPGDQLSAAVSGVSIPLLKSDSGGYTGLLDNVAGGSEINIKFSRLDAVDASNSRVTLPKAFELTAPALAETFKSGETITAAWSPNDPANTVLVNYSIDCTASDNNGIPYGKEYSVADTGTHTASIDEILNVLGTQDKLVSGISCPLEIKVERINYGTLDNAFTKGGSILATREQSRLVNVIP